MRRLIEWVANRLPLRSIAIDGDEYLRRYYVCGRLYGQELYDREPKVIFGFLPFTVFLHHFVRPDRDRELHNHPWDRSVSFVLSGGYDEERLSTEYVIRWGIGGLEEISFVENRKYSAPSVNVIRANDFHRVAHVRKGTWTLFVTGRKVQTWGFRLSDGTFMQWRDFLNEGRQEECHALTS